MSDALRQEERMELNYAGAQKCDRCKTMWPANSDGVQTIEFEDGEKFVACEEPCRQDMLDANDSFECVQCLIAFDNSEKTGNDGEDELCQGCA